MSNNFISWSPGVTLLDVEKQVILAAFRHYRGNKTAASIALGISVKTLDGRLKEYQDETKTKELKDAAERSKRAAELKRARGLSGRKVEGTDTRVRMEPAFDSAAKPTMPMPERAQVQNLSPKQTPKSGTGKAR